jgi:uncharacterized SAM-binding protein YcdF (DUF218 family)
MGDGLGLLKGLVSVLAMPMPMALGLALVGLGLAGVGRRRSGLFLAVMAMLTLVLSAWQPVADALLQPLESRYQPIVESHSLAGIRAVVVLGASWEADADWPAGARLSDSSALRLMEGLRLLQGLPEAVLVVSGGSRRAGQATVAEGYAAAANALGVPLERIRMLRTPQDTAQEAYAVLESLGTEQGFLLVTAASHMRRAVEHFERAGLAPVPAPTHFLTGRGGPERFGYWVPAAEHLRKTERAIYEYLGLLALELDHRRAWP